MIRFFIAANFPITLIKCAGKQKDLDEPKSVVWRSDDQMAIMPFDKISRREAGWR